MQFTQTIAMSELQEVGAVPADTASDGAYDITFDSMTGMLIVSGAYSDLTSALSPVGAPDLEANPQSAIHVHIGRFGENGPILRNLTVSDNGDGSGTFSGSFMLAADEIDRFEVRELYVNLHTVNNPGGELRGQMSPFDAEDIISTGSEIPLQFGQQPDVGPADDGSSGDFDVTFNSQTNTLSISGTYDGVSSPLTAVGAPDAEGNPTSAMHVHFGTVDDNGPIVRNLTVTANNDGTGSYEGLFNLTPAEAQQFLTGQFYINQHTQANPSGGLRGQVISEGNLSQTITGRQIALEESQEVGNVPADTAATAAADVTFHAGSNTLFVEGTFSDLTSMPTVVGNADSEDNPPSALHIHLGAPGNNGGIVRNLTVTVDESGVDGSFTGLFALSDSEAVSFQSGDLYFNLHTVNNPGGELRGQVFVDELNRGEVVINNAILEEAQEVGSVPADGAATGAFDVSFDPLTQELDISGTFSGLTSALNPVGNPDGAGNPQSAAHIHIGAAGTNGPIARNLTITDNGDGSGSFSNSFLLTDDEAASFDQGLLYVNLHTVGNPGGELRGQLFEAAQQSGRLAGVGLVIEERQEVGAIPPDDDASMGSFNMLADPETGMVQVSGTFSGLTSSLAPVGNADAEGNPQSAVHFHVAEAGANGPILRNFSTTENGDGSGTFIGSFQLTSIEIQSILDSGIYVNLHTVNNPGGELRGQVFVSELVAEDETGVMNLLGTVQNGTAGNDVLRGLEDADTFNAGLGTDIVDGRGGSDTLVLRGLDGGGFDLIQFGGTAYSLDKANGSFDTVMNVEIFQGVGQSVSLAQVEAFDPLAYAASYNDLAQAFGIDANAALSHYLGNGFGEGREVTFDATQYLANYADLADAFGMNNDAARDHFLNNGVDENRLADDPLDYIASYSDLIGAFGGNDISTLRESGLSHYADNGANEGRRSGIDFEADQYLANYDDLSAFFGTDTDGATVHFINNGFGESRLNSDPLEYIASHADLTMAFGDQDQVTLTQSGLSHYQNNGLSEGRDTDTFDVDAYLANYDDLRTVFADGSGGYSETAATVHYIQFGFDEGRVDDLITL